MGLYAFVFNILISRLLDAFSHIQLHQKIYISKHEVIIAQRMGPVFEMWSFWLYKHMYELLQIVY